MPYAHRKPCPTPGCPELLAPGQRRCTTHGQQHEQQRGSRQQRGYDRKHDQLRAKWAPIVATGTVKCWRCDEPITSTEPWDLGHDDNDRTQYRGPEHANKCNRRAGGLKAHRGTAATPPPF